MGIHSMLRVIELYVAVLCVYEIYTLPNTVFILLYLVCTLKCKIRYLSEHIYTWMMLW